MLSMLEGELGLLLKEARPEIHAGFKEVIKMAKDWVVQAVIEALAEAEEASAKAIEPKEAVCDAVDATEASKRCPTPSNLPNCAHEAADALAVEMRRGRE
jgi:hypothetical protein